MALLAVLRIKTFEPAEMYRNLPVGEAAMAPTVVIFGDAITVSVAVSTTSRKTGPSGSSEYPNPAM
jgi:hypothetical protein